MLQPKKVKFRKQFKLRSLPSIATRGTDLEFGEFGIKVLESGVLSARQIEAARKAIAHSTKRGGRIWIRIFPDVPVTKKPPETRMGSGKGSVEGYIAKVEKGKILIEVGGLEKEIALESLKLARAKISLKTKVVGGD